MSASALKRTAAMADGWPRTMRKIGWSTVLLAASIVPSALMAFVIFNVLCRSSGAEAWGDGSAIAYLGAAANPLAILFSPPERLSPCSVVVCIASLG